MSKGVTVNIPKEMIWLIDKGYMVSFGSYGSGSDLYWVSTAPDTFTGRGSGLQDAIEDLWKQLMTVGVRNL